MVLKRFFLAHWAILLIVIIAAILRFWHLTGLTTFSGDQGYDFLIVKRMLVDGKFTLLGPKIGPYNQTGNLYLGPAYYYLVAPFLFLFNFDPIGPAVLTAFSAVLTIILIYLICNKFISYPVAILAATIYALNSLLINQSRAPSNPHLIPFFSSLFLFSLLEIAVEKSKRIIWPLVTGFCLGIMFQLHYLSIALVAPMLVALLYSERKNSGIYAGDIQSHAVLGLHCRPAGLEANLERGPENHGLQAVDIYSKKIKKLGPIVFVFMITIAPQIFFEIRHNFFITHLFINQFKSGQALSSLSRISFNFSNLFQSLAQPFLGFKQFTALLIIILTGLSLSYFIKNKKVSKLILIFLFTAILANIILVSFYSGSFGIHYFAPIYPPFIILIAIAFVSLVDLVKSFFLKVIVFLLLAQLFTLNLLSLNYSQKEGYTMPEGLNLNGIKKSARIIANDVNPAKTFNIAATLDGDTRARPYRYLTEVYGKKPLDVENYPDAGFLYLISRDDPKTIKSYTVWEVASFEPFSIVDTWDIQNGIKLYKLSK